MTQLDEKALEAADAEAALAAAARLTSNIRDVEDSYVVGTDFESNARERQRVRLLDRRRLEAEFQTRCVYFNYRTGNGMTSLVMYSIIY